MLRGKAGCGKTTTMHQVFDDIFKKIDKTDDVIIPKTFTDDGKDFWATIRYNGKTIYFYSLGDLSGEICEALETNLNKEYNIHVCCAQIRFKNPLNFIAKHSIELACVDKISATDDDNLRASRELIELINASTK